MPQYEVESKISYFQSYADDIITGSMLPTGNRGYVGSYVSGNVKFQSATIYSEYIDLYGKKDATGFSRTKRFFSNEVFYDSIVPDIFQIYRQNNGKIVFSQYDTGRFPQVATGQFLKLVFGTQNARVTGSDSSQISDNKWLSSFPFMNDYLGVSRKLINAFPVNSNSYTEISASNVPLFYVPVSATSSLSSSNSYYINIAGNIAPNFYFPTNCYEFSGSVSGEVFTPAIRTALQAKAFNKIIFGSKLSFGLYSSSFIYGQDAVIPLIRGWKYGLINASKTKSSVVYRLGRFGQFRDMLEQRLYTKFYNFNTSKTSSPISIIFMSGSEAAITASNPAVLNVRTSGIYDSEYKTGVPWQDV